MSISRKLLLSLAIVALAQTTVLAAMVIDRVRLLSSGREITLPIVPVDPRDLFRGEYVRLGYDVGRVPIDGAGEGGALATLVLEGAGVLDPRVCVRRCDRVGNAKAERAVPRFRLAHDAHGREDLAMLALVEREHRLADVRVARCVDAHRGGEGDARRVGRVARLAAGLVDVLIEDAEPRGERVERRHGRQPRTGRRTSAPNGGSTRAIDCSKPCSGSGSVSTRASVRTPLPP